MNLGFRITILFALFIVFQTSLFGIQINAKSKAEKIVLTDSIVKKQIQIIDSLSILQNNYADLQIDSLLNFLLSNAISSKLESDVVGAKWRFLRRLSKHQESIVFLNSEISKSSKDKPELYLALADAYQINNDFSKSIECSQTAILIYEGIGELEKVADATNFLISTYSEIGMTNEARKYFVENLKLCNSINYNYGLMVAYQQYGEALAFENPELSYELLQTGDKLAKSIGGKTYCSTALVLLRFYINNGRYNTAKSEIRKYLKRCEGDDKLRDSNAFTLLAHIYSLEENIDSTIFYNKLALATRMNLGNKKAMSNSYLNLSGNYLLKGDIETANDYLEKAKSTVIESNNTEMLLVYYRGKVKYAEYIKDFENAFVYSQKEIKLSDEIAIKSHQAALSKLNTSFEIQQKNRLLERELEKRKAATRLFIFIASLVLLLLSGGYLVYLYRKKNYSYLKLARKTSSIERKLSISDKERLKFQSVFEYSVTGILILDKNGIVQYANRKSVKYIGQSGDANILRLAFVDFFEGDNKDSVDEALLNVFIEQKADTGIKVQIIHKKSFHWLDISFAPLLFEHEDDNILVTLIDVTQEVINIGREQKQRQELQTLVNSVTESILFIQRNGKIQALNNTATSRLSFSNENLIGANYFEKLPDSLRKKRTLMFDKVVLTKKPLIELEMIGNYNNLVSMYPNININGEVDYISEFVQDITERRVAEEQIDNLKQRVLRSQMNPHFIFNSLTSIQSFVIRNDASMASKYLNSFARLIRLILESSRHDYISLKSEIDILTYYLEIQKMRFSDNFTYSFEIDEDLDLERIKIPPMLAQPFIENSIEHGIQHLDSIGELNIRFVKDDSRLMFELRDNGIGREASDKMNKENLFATKSLSTKITNDRLTSLNKYAKDLISYNIIDLKDEFNQSAGTQVIISIPIERI